MKPPQRRVEMTTTLTSTDVKKICLKLFRERPDHHATRYWTNTEFDSQQTLFEQTCTNNELIWSAPDHQTACFIGGVLRFVIDDLKNILFMFRLDDEGERQTGSDSEDSDSDTDSKNDSADSAGPQMLGGYQCLYYCDYSDDMNERIVIQGELSQKELEDFVFNNFNAKDECVVEVLNVITTNSQVVDLMVEKTKTRVSKSTRSYHRDCKTCVVEE